MKRFDPKQTAAVSLSIHAVGGIGYLLIGLTQPSWWFLSVGVYDLVLAILRLILITAGRLEKKEKPWVETLTGWMLMGAAFPLMGMAILATVKERGRAFHEIVMIAIALYAFTKITLAIIHLVKAKRQASSVERALRHVSLADAVVSIASLQRSMLVTFGEMTMTADNIRLFNALTGTGACVAVFLLGLLLKKRNRSSIR